MVRRTESIQRKDGRKPGKVKDMTFNELLDIKPSVRVADIIQLFLLGYDDKIYLNLATYDSKGYEVYLLNNERIIHEEWETYYENKVTMIQEENVDEDMGYLTLFIERDENK